MKGFVRAATGIACLALTSTVSIRPTVAQVASPESLPIPGQAVESAAVEPSGETAYTLGAGDRIQLEIFDVPEFSAENGQHSVQVDGSLTLPWVGKIFVAGMTLEEASQTLTTAYAPLINDPLISISLLSPRPLRIGVVGEVKRPGSYTITLTQEENETQWQTVTQAIQQAGGITQLADIRNIQVYRPQRSGGQQVINANLWEFLKSGDLNQDIVLRDGDTLVVPTATALDSSEAAQTASANFAPDTIAVNVVGEVMEPGSVELEPNTTLNQAILAAGGFDNARARRTEVELIRLNPNGTVDRRTIDVDLSAALNEETNPALRDNDVVVVNRSGLARTTDLVNILLTPLRGVLGFFQLFGN